ncbi:hypothetical protein OF83DRAFT_231053 [Amylostereum chailletii]|nr:hypothetical protein OF83DRAFT_231053 [Amylostereum chailletii]
MAFRRTRSRRREDGPTEGSTPALQTHPEYEYPPRPPSQKVKREKGEGEGGPGGKTAPLDQLPVTSTRGPTVQEFSPRAASPLCAPLGPAIRHLNARIWQHRPRTSAQQKRTITRTAASHTPWHHHAASPISAPKKYTPSADGEKKGHPMMISWPGRTKGPGCFPVCFPAFLSPSMGGAASSCRRHGPDLRYLTFLTSPPN